MQDELIQFAAVLYSNVPQGLDLADCTPSALMVAPCLGTQWQDSRYKARLATTWVMLGATVSRAINQGPFTALDVFGTDSSVFLFS